jgi:hypothetical protein
MRPLGVVTGADCAHAADTAHRDTKAAQKNDEEDFTGIPRRMGKA